MKHAAMSWPTLLLEGGWQTVKHPGQYWPEYIREHLGFVQHIRMDGLDWVLEVATLGEVARGGLDFVMLKAERVFNERL